MLLSAFLAATIAAVSTLSASSASGTPQPGSHCDVYFPGPDMYFSASSLQLSPGSFYSVVVDGSNSSATVDFDVCGPVGGGFVCGDNAKAAACSNNVSLGDWSDIKWSILQVDGAGVTGFRASTTAGAVPCYYQGFKVPRTLNFDFMCSSDPPEQPVISASNNESDSGCSTTITVTSADASCSDTTDAVTCQFTDERGMSVDLRELTLQAGSSYAYGATSDDGSKYSFNVCGQAAGCGGDEVEACQHQRDGSVTAVSKWQPLSTTWYSIPGVNSTAPPVGVGYTTTNGELCDIDGVSLLRTAAFDFVCDGNAGDMGQVTVNSVANATLCETRFTIPTSLTCRM